MSANGVAIDCMRGGCFDNDCDYEHGDSLGIANKRIRGIDSIRRVFHSQCRFVITVGSQPRFDWTWQALGENRFFHEGGKSGSVEKIVKQLVKFGHEFTRQNLELDHKALRRIAQAYPNRYRNLRRVWR